MVKESITTPISEKKNIETVNKTEKPQASNKTVNKHRSNKTEKVKSIDKSRSTKITETENTVDKSRYIPRTNLSNKSTIIENRSEIYIRRENLSVSVLFEHGEILSSVTSNILRIPRINKIKKTPDNLIIIKQPTKEHVKPKKRAKEIPVNDVEKCSPKEIPPSC